MGIKWHKTTGSSDQKPVEHKSPSEAKSKPYELVFMPPNKFEEMVNFLDHSAYFLHVLMAGREKGHDLSRTFLIVGNFANFWKLVKMGMVIKVKPFKRSACVTEQDVERYGFNFFIECFEVFMDGLLNIFIEDRLAFFNRGVTPEAIRAIITEAGGGEYGFNPQLGGVENFSKMLNNALLKGI